MAKPYYVGDFGNITIEENDESEFKVGYVFSSEINNPSRFETVRDEGRIADVAKEIWYVYRSHRYAFEAAAGLTNSQLMLADQSLRPSYHAEQGKENRLRYFLVLADEHPKDLEIRTEDKDGERILMLKKGNGATSGSPVIRRKEFKLVADVRETPSSILRHIPLKYKKELGFSFNKKSKVYNPMQTNSQRLKTKVRLQETSYGPLEFHIELAHDQGSGLTVNGLRWPIREYEAEVKGIYRPNDKIDVKENPQLLGIGEEEVGHLCEEVLKVEQEDFIEFSNLYLLSKTRDNPDRYGDINIEPIYYSKSHPGLILLDDFISQGKKAMKSLCYDKKGDPRPFNW